MDHPFRSSMFGGFNRQDVLDYLESTAKTAAEQQQGLQLQLDEVRQTESDQTIELAARQGRIFRLEQENQQLLSQVEQLNLSLSALQAENSKNAAALTEARREVEELKAKVTALEPDAMAYSAVKERTAGVELEAHRRAQNIQAEAEQQAKQLRRQMEQWVARVEREYAALRSQVESTVAHAADQLSRAGESLDQVNALMNQQEVELEELVQAYASADPNKVEAPMPIPEQE